MSHDVFISYSSKDKPAADALCAALENARIRCWIAPRDVLPGRAFAGEIKRAIEQCKVVVLVFSSHSNCSEDVLREMQLAAKNHCHIINFRIEDVHTSDDLDYYLSAPHWLDALTPPMERYHSQLIQSVKALLSMTSKPAGEKSSAAHESPSPPPIPSRPAATTNASSDVSAPRSDPLAVVKKLWPGL
jgi:hypothetical protein